MGPGWTRSHLNVREAGFGSFKRTCRTASSAPASTNSCRALRAPAVRGSGRSVGPESPARGRFILPAPVQRRSGGPSSKHARRCGYAGAKDLKSPLTDSNRRPPPYHGGALPTELRGHFLVRLAARRGLLFAGFACRSIGENQLAISLPAAIYASFTDVLGIFWFKGRRHTGFILTHQANFLR